MVVGASLGFWALSLVVGALVWAWARRRDRRERAREHEALTLCIGAIRADTRSAVAHLTAELLAAKLEAQAARRPPEAREESPTAPAPPPKMTDRPPAPDPAPEGMKAAPSPKPTTGYGFVKAGPPSSAPVPVASRVPHPLDVVDQGEERPTYYGTAFRIGQDEKTPPSGTPVAFPPRMPANDTEDEPEDCR